jgi:hypothetical protein
MRPLRRGRDRSLTRDHPNTAAASAATPPTATANRGLVCSAMAPTIGPPIGVEPINATEKSDITRPRSSGLECNWSVAFERAMTVTLDAPSNGIIM